MLDTEKNLRYIDYLLVISFFLISFMIRVAGISTVYANYDEIIHLRQTFLIIANNWYPGVEIEIVKSQAPLFPYVLAIITTLFEGSLEVLRIGSVIPGSLTVCFIYLLGKEMYDRRVGLLAAFFLCFSTYHIFYSRMILLESLTMFFIAAFAYFFWKGYFKEKGMRYIFIAGIMMGLAFDTKYIAFFLIPFVFFIVLWTKRSFKALIEKRFLLIWIGTLLSFAPLLIILHVTGVGALPFLFHAIERFEILQEGASGLAIKSLGIKTIITGGLRYYVNILTFGHYKIMPFYSFVQLIFLILLPITLLFNTFYFIKAKKEESFLLLLSFCIILFLFAGCAPHRYYFIHLLPPYFIMLSRLSIQSIDRLKEMHTKRAIGEINVLLWIFIILPICIIIFSYFIAGIASPLERGTSEGLYECVNYIEHDVVKDGNNNVIIISSEANLAIKYYLCDMNINAFLMNILKQDEKSKRLKLNIEGIRIIKPDYIIINKMGGKAGSQGYKSLFPEGIKKELFENYKLVFEKRYEPSIISVDYGRTFFVLKRFDKSQRDLILGGCNASGEICSELFSATVPSVMKIGSYYTALVKIKNTGNVTTNYTVILNADERYIFIDKILGFEHVELEKGSESTVKFKLVPLKKCDKELRVTAELYVQKYKNNELYRICMLDHVSDSVYAIRRLL